MHHTVCRDDKGRWYVSYIMNWLKLHNSFPKTTEDSINPGQIWMIPVTPESGKSVRVIEGLKPGIKRRVLSNGVAVRRVENMGSGHQALSLDRELLFRDKLKSGLVAIASQQLLVPKNGNYTIWARVKCRRAEERSKFRVRLGETDGGHITVDTTKWRWIRASVEAIPLLRGKISLQYTTAHTGILVDQFLITTEAEDKTLK